MFSEPISVALLLLGLLLSNLAGGMIQMYCIVWEKKRAERAAAEEGKEWKPL